MLCSICKKPMTTGLALCEGCSKSLVSNDLSPELSLFIDQLSILIVEEYLDVVICNKDTKDHAIKQTKKWLTEQAKAIFPVNQPHTQKDK